MVLPAEQTPNNARKAEEDALAFHGKFEVKPTAPGIGSVNALMGSDAKQASDSQPHDLLVIPKPSDSKDAKISTNGQ